MKTLCSFCNTVIHPGNSAEDPVSHGVCTICYDRILAEHGFNIRKFLNMLDVPVVLVDNDATILAANSLALSIIKRPVNGVPGKKFGFVFDCINASLPGGCGKTAFCPNCIIRNTIVETYSTGIPVINRPALIHQHASKGESGVPLCISTQKDGDVVLLRFEPTE